MDSSRKIPHGASWAIAGCGAPRSMTPAAAAKFRETVLEAGQNPWFLGPGTPSVVRGESEGFEMASLRELEVVNPMEGPMLRGMKEAWHRIGTEEAARRLETDPRRGLSADEVRRRLATQGPNRIRSRPGTPAWKRFLLQFAQPLTYILLLAACVTGFLGVWVDSAVIALVVVVNAIVGFLQESKAEKAIEALGNLVMTEATVRRDGTQRRVPSEDLVPGDVVLLQSGDRVPADLRLSRVRSLQVDESALTGESVPVAKHADPLEEDVVLGDRKNTAYAGTLVASGVAEGLVWATGDATETGRIARLISGTTPLATPLTRKIEQFSNLLLKVILALTVLTFGVGLLHGEPLGEVFMASVALAVGAIPEGLPAAVTIVLAVGVKRMAARKAIIRKLPAVETLGSTTVVCSDKTGTLTENQMTVRRVFAGGQSFEVTGSGYSTTGEILREGRVVDPSRSPALVECLRAGLLCNDSRLLVEGGRAVVQGDPTEASLAVAAAKGGLLRDALHRESPRVDMIPFESEHMFRATLHDSAGGRVIYKVGAVERLLDRCADALAPDGTTMPLDRVQVRHAVEEMAREGLRVLAMARRATHTGHDRLEHEHVGQGLTFLGLQGMIDPPRPEAIRAVARCREAGIRVKMITGDHATTARAVAVQIGLVDPGSEVRTLTGRELERIPDADLPEVAERTPVFARVAPEQKLRLVRALQARGHIVAMTGDGVNDAPALRQADIGIAMGISGTDVAKGAADMILTDDNFATLVAAVEQGRGVFDNLRKFIVWTLPTNASEAAVLLIAIVLGLTLPMLPVHLLWINLCTAICLGLMLVFEPNEPDLMQRPPRDPSRPLLTRALLMRTGLVTFLIAAGSYWLFFFERNLPGNTIEAARTAVVDVIVVVETAYLFNCRSFRHGLLRIGCFSNPLAIWGAVSMIGIQVLFTHLPIMNRLFHSAPLTLWAWVRIAAVALGIFLIVEIEKWVRFGGGRGKNRDPE
jgi:cation-transporting ATPase F